MKTLKLIVLLISAFFLQSCCSLFKTDCPPCEDIQQGAELADLLLDDFESIIVQNEEEGSVAYDIIHTIVNLATNFECPEEVTSAGNHMDRLQLIYSEDENFTNPVVVESQTANVNQTTNANDNYQVVSEIAFQTAGFYIIDNSIDNTNLVPERNEANNNDENALGARLSKTSFSSYTVIHITETMLQSTTKKVTSKNPKYISKWNVSVY
ncbi:hypothetical protein WNY78_09665 [Psychroserpens sp. AS72]|uniref:hypothetical protein n=1 Tax=Psychroserpens sp. AS72 TaxID=3135775 RepID=UPI00317C5522